MSSTFKIMTINIDLDYVLIILSTVSSLHFLFKQLPRSKIQMLHTVALSIYRLVQQYQCTSLGFISGERFKGASWGLSISGGACGSQLWVYNPKEKWRNTLAVSKNIVLHCVDRTVPRESSLPTVVIEAGYPTRAALAINWQMFHHYWPLQLCKLKSCFAKIPQTCQICFKRTR